ncbi:MAG TPA: amidase [Acidimicrobiales bacterium]|jgi:aspartyl-tRNA(Asn)/glutamyl-tRNA(Gln) amidotransferase subunit A
MDFRDVTVTDLAAQVSAGKLSARELVATSLERIEQLDDKLGSFVAVDGEAALAEAAALDERIAHGEEIGPLAGIPLAVKDLEDAAGFVTSHGSAAFAERRPATDDSPLVERLRAAGCIVVGKTNTPELGWKPDTVNQVFGATHNPWSLGRSAGGSSGGSAAAIAAGLVPLATGSDGGGSIRIPSSICGLSGMKPSLGRVPSGGTEPPGWPGFSTKGVMARSIRDVTLGLDAVVGPEATDMYSLPMPDSSWSRSLADLGPPRKVAWSPTLGYAHPDREVVAVCEAAVRRLEALGTEVVVIDEVLAEDPVGEWLAFVAAACLRTLGHLRGTDQWGSIDPGLVALMEWGRASITPVQVIESLDACHRVNVTLVELFHDASLLLTPTVAGQTPMIGANGTIDGEPDVNWVRFTYPFNMTRSPAGTVCAGFTEVGMPVGLQVIGPQHADVAVLRLLALLEDTLAIDVVAPFGT